jgi:folate-binding protein YgfZ
METTLLHGHLERRGAVHRPERGLALPASFGDPAAEYGALRTEAAAFDLGYREILRVTGADRVDFLQGMLSNDVARLAPGAGCPALMLTIQGRVTADLRVAVTTDAIWLDVDRRARPALVEALEARLIADEVELALDESRALIGLEGPHAAEVLPVVASLPAFGHGPGEIAGCLVHVWRTSVLAAPGGAAVLAAAPDAPAVWDALVAAGARPCGQEALESRRVEVGIPRIGVDMGEPTLALEVPVEGAVSDTKGCYLGQEVIARGTARGHVNRRLCALEFDGPLPPPETPLVRDGKEVGRVTSALVSLGLGRPIGMGMVRRECWEPGTELAARHGHAVTVARVARWPLA